jgi:type II secretory pathway pseudopilin PulG
METNRQTKGGYTLLEVLIAIGLGALFFSGASGLFLTAQHTSAEALTRQTALWKAQEGIEALNTMSFADIYATQVGSLSFASNTWTLGTSAPESLSNEMTRTITVEEVERDGNCGVVQSGGVVDTDTFAIESEVSWTDLKGNNQTVVLNSMRTNWEDPSGSCFESDCSALDWNVLDAEWFGGKQLREIYITNNTGETKEIDKMTLTWDFPTDIQQIFFDSSKFWSSGGPGTPLGNQPSGTELDGANGIIADGQTIEMHKTQFKANMEGSTITIMYECTDGSELIFGPFIPIY